MPTAKFGFRLPNVRGYHSFDYIKDLALKGEYLGFDSIWVSDHLLYPEQYAEIIGSRSFFEGLTTLAVISSITDKILLGASVLLPLRNPVLTASVVSTIDHSSKGRLLLGFGVGWYKPEFENLGIAFNRRGMVNDEQIELLVDLWTKPRTSFDGKFYKISNMVFDSKPYQKPHPKLLIGGNVPHASRRIGRFGGGWIPTALNTSQYEDGLLKIRDSCAKNGRDLNDMLFAIDLPVCIYDDEPPKDEIEFLCKWLGKNLEELKDTGIVCKAEEAVHKLWEYIDVGVRHFDFSFAPFGREKEMLEMISHEILPKM